jgi:nucleoside-triphosphatase
VIFCKSQPETGWEKIRKFYVNPLGIRFGIDALDLERLKKTDLVVIDEVGPFELRGKGWAVPLKALLENFSKDIVLIIRKSLLEEVIGFWKLKDPAIYDIAESSAEELLAKILKEN